MRFISKVVRTFFCAAVVLFLFSCSDNFNKRSGNFTFTLNPNIAASIIKDERETEVANLSLEVKLTGEYEDLKNVSLSNTSGIKVRFSDIPVGVKIKAEVKVFSLSSGSGERTVLWSGDSAYFFVLEGENSVDVQMKKISTEEPEEPGEIINALDSSCYKIDFTNETEEAVRSWKSSNRNHSGALVKISVAKKNSELNGIMGIAFGVHDGTNGKDFGAIGIRDDGKYYVSGYRNVQDFQANNFGATTNRGNYYNAEYTEPVELEVKPVGTSYSGKNTDDGYSVYIYFKDSVISGGKHAYSVFILDDATDEWNVDEKTGKIFKDEAKTQETDPGTPVAVVEYNQTENDAVQYELSYFATVLSKKTLKGSWKAHVFLTDPVVEPEPTEPGDIKDGLVEGLKSYYVCDVAGLRKLSEIVNGTDTKSGNSLAGYTITQTADITVNESVLKDGFLEPEEGENCTPNPNLVNLDSIGCNKGDSSKPFCGTFDGNGKVIKGLYIYQAHQGLGFIGTSGTGAVIKDLTIIDACVINSNASAEADGSDDDRMGGIIGLVSGATEINNCVFTGVVGSAAAKARGGSYEYIDGFVGRADAVVNTSKCIVFARTYGAPNIKVTMNGDVTKYDAAAYKPGDYTGDNKYVLAAIELLNIQQEPEPQSIPYVPAIEVKSENGSSVVQISFTKNNTPNSYIYDTERDPGCNYPIGIIPETAEEGVTYTLYRAQKSSTSDFWEDAKRVGVVNNGQAVNSDNCIVYKWDSAGACMSIYNSAYTYVDSIVYTYLDINLSSGTSYRYYVIASNQSGEGRQSNVVEISINKDSVLVPPSAPYAETPAGEVSEGTNLRFYADLESGDRAATIYYEFVKDGEFSTLTAENYAAVGIKYERAISALESGTFYCIAEHDGLVSEVVSFTYTVITPPGRTEGLAAVETKIATMTHAEVTATADIKDGLVDGVTAYKVSDTAGLDKLAEIVNGTGSIGDENYVAPNTLSGYTFTVANDITINDKVLTDGFKEPEEGPDCTPNPNLVNLDSIGMKGKPFCGTFDGNGYTIRGLYIYQAYQGLAFIGETGDGAVIKNVILRDVCVINSNASGELDSNDDDRFGLLVGTSQYSSGTITIDNCVVEGVIGSEAAKNRGGSYEYGAAIMGEVGKSGSTITITISNCIALARNYTDSNKIVVNKERVSAIQTNVYGYDASK